MWLMAMAGIPLLVIAVDVLYTRTFSDQLREIIFRPQNPQGFEERDVIYAWVILAFAVIFLVWGLKELFFPTSVVECRDEGLAVTLRGPFRPSTLIPWSQIFDIRADEAEDEGTRLRLMTIDLRSTDGIPENPWGARWLASRRLGILADDWAETPELVVPQIMDYAREPIAGAWLGSRSEEE